MIKNKLLNKLPSSVVQSRQWSLYDLQYILIAAIMLIDFCLIKSPALLPRLLLAAVFIATFWIPYIRRFTVPALPIFTWLLTFYACQFIPINYRPTHIFVNLLPTLERILYGANLSEIISKHTHPILDILTWLPYGIGHFSFPFVFSLLLFIFGPPGSLKVFGSAFGYMNLAGVLTQLFFPNASPWYEIIYGSAPADYSIPGEAGGLLRIDAILGLDLYSSTFGNSPLVFGAFPSLHSGCATLEMLFVVYLCPRLKPVALLYVLWMWFATMYLTHHYMIDLVGGSIYAILTFAVAQKFLPQVNPDAGTRMEYLRISKLSFRSFISSIERDSGIYGSLPTTIDDEESAMKEIDTFATNNHHSRRPEPLDLRDIKVEDDSQAPALSPSSGYWSSTSEPTSPMTPHSSPARSLQFNKPA